VEVKKLFPEKFDSIKGPSANFPIYIQHPTSHIWYEVEKMEDIYKNAVLEARDNSATPGKKDVLLGDRRGRRIDYSSLYMDKLVFVMVGLPARGKTYIARKICRYINWLGLPTRLFNVGSYRRAKLGAKQTLDFFDPANKKGRTSRLHMAVLALDDMFDWLGKGGQVGIFDATNTTAERRALIRSRCDDEHVQAIFIESICEDPVIIESNLRQTKLSSPE